MKSLCLAPLALAVSLPFASAASFAPILQNTLTSTDGQLVVYEATGGGNIYYYADVLNGTSTYATLAISGRGGSYIGQSSALGTRDAAAGVYPASSWSSFSSIPFATFFGPTDNTFIIIRGGNPLTDATDYDGSTGFAINNFTAARAGLAASAFVAFGPSGNVLSSTSGVVPEPSALISSALGAIGLLVRRRRK